LGVHRHIEFSGGGGPGKIRNKVFFKMNKPNDIRGSAKFFQQWDPNKGEKGGTGNGKRSLGSIF